MINRRFRATVDRQPNNKYNSLNDRLIIHILLFSVSVEPTNMYSQSQGVPTGGDGIVYSQSQGVPSGGDGVTYSQSQGVPVGGDGVMYTQSQGVPSDMTDGGKYPVASASAPLFPSLPTGYSHSGDTAFIVPPPAYDQIAQTTQRTIQPLQVAVLTEEEIRAAVAKHVSGKVFYSNAAAREMSYASIEPCVCYVYNLQTFTESRETAWKYEPHRGTHIVDGPHNGPIPGPWEVPVFPKQEFFQDKTKVIVPHSEHVVQCHTCFGARNTRCHHCAGMGSKGCSWCSGSGIRTQFDERRTCTSCSGSGRDRCTWCHGNGFSTCKTCSGSGQLKYYIELKVNWNILSDHVISNSCDLPEKKIIEAPKVKLFEETGVVLTALSPNEFVDQTIVNSSVDLIHQHMTKGRTERVLRMRQVISALPVTIVCYQRKNKRDSFFVYGDDRKVHFGSYPSKNCCIS